MFFTVSAGTPPEAGTWFGKIRIADEVEFRLHAHQDRVVNTVISAFHLDDLVPPGKTTRDADGVQVTSVPLLPKRTVHGKALANLVCQVVFQGVRHAVHGAGNQPLLHRGNHRRVAMAGHQRAETKIEIDVLMAIEIVNVGSLGVFDKQGPRLVTAEVAGYAQRHAGFGALERCFRTRGTCFKGREFLLEKVVHGDSSLPRGLSMMQEAGCSQQNALAKERTREGRRAQPAFATGVAEKPAHPAKGACDAAIFVAGEKRHWGRFNYTLPRINPYSNF